MKQDKITAENIKKYREITQKALDIARKSISRGKEKEAKEILAMAEAYISDSRHFESKSDLVSAFGAIYYANGWLDCGARLKILDVSDANLFAI